MKFSRGVKGVTGGMQGVIERSNEVFLRGTTCYWREQ